MKDNTNSSGVSTMNLTMTKRKSFMPYGSSADLNNLDAQNGNLQSDDQVTHGQWCMEMVFSEIFLQRIGPLQQEIQKAQHDASKM